jgi:hypothetical protein
VLRPIAVRPIGNAEQLVVRIVGGPEADDSANCRFVIYKGLCYSKRGSCETASVAVGRHVYPVTFLRSFSAALTCATYIAIAVGASVHIADDSLPTLIDVHVLDADKLIAALTEPPKYLNLVCKSS